MPRPSLDALPYEQISRQLTAAREHNAQLSGELSELQYELRKVSERERDAQRARARVRFCVRAIGGRARGGGGVGACIRLWHSCTCLLPSLGLVELATRVRR
jgi:hypothetical protein